MATATMNTIEREIVVHAPVSRVWKALTDVKEFSQWFGVRAKGQFKPGARVDMVSTQPGYEGIEWFVLIEDVEPERRFSWKWHPGANQADRPADEPPTLVVFELIPVANGTRVKITESGFDKISLSRRARVFEDNSGGWKQQMQNLQTYVDAAAKA
jgi:uncharacterized protein YndB with AHSA1/START domain